MKRFLLFSFNSILLLAILLCMDSSGMTDAAEYSKVIRVGYFDFPGFNNNKDGIKSGYGYDYLHEIAKYTNYTYEYIEGTWEECQEMLRNGDIDILASAHYSEIRDKEFDYTDYPIGTSNCILTVKSSNSRYINGDYDNFNGISVGLMRGNSRNEAFYKFCEENSIEFHEVLYSDVTSLTKALETEEVEAIMTSTIRFLGDERIIAEFEPASYYIIVREGNTELLEELNTALKYISINNPALQSELYYKYYSSKYRYSVMLTEDERKYVRENRIVRMLMASDTEPLTYFEDGECRGITTDILRNAIESSGLQLQFIVAEDTESYKELLKSGTVDAIGVVYKDYDKAEKNNIRLTESYMPITFSMLSRYSDNKDSFKIAAINSDALNNTVHILPLQIDEIIYYNNISDCIEKVIEDPEYIVVMNSYSAQRLIYNKPSKNFQNTIISGYSAELSVGIPRSEDPRLFSIINKCILAIDPVSTDSIIMQHTINYDPKLDITEMLYRNSTVYFLAAFVVLTLIIIAQQYRSRKKEKQLLSRIIHYSNFLFNSCSDITELNLIKETVSTINTDSEKSSPLQNDDRNILHVIRHIEEYIHENDRDTFLAHANITELQRLVDNTTTDEFECRIKYSDGAYHWMNYFIQGLPKEREHPGNLLIYRRDIDEMKQVEIQKQHHLEEALMIAEKASRVKGEFLSHMSHEIRTPMNAIMGYLAIIQNNPKDWDRIDEYITKAGYASRHLLELINEILDVSAIESGKITLHTETFSLGKMISDISLLFTTMTEEKELKFRVEREGITVNNIVGDRVRMKQIIINLLSNAVKFTDKGGHVNLRVIQKSRKDNRVFLRFIIEDNGIGMSDEFLTRIGKPFEQQDMETSIRYGGTGLGILISKNLLRLMDGEMYIDSAPGKGSAFTVDVPFEVTDGISAYDDADKNEAVKYHFNKERVLLVEDNFMNMEIARNLMENAGLLVDSAVNGKEAVRIFEASESGTYSLILMDIRMPVMNGYSATSEIRSSDHPDAVSVPIVALTANAFIDDINSAMACGMNDYLTKPIEVGKLFSIIQKFID